MTFTTADSVALKAAITQSKGCVIRETATYQFSDLAGSQVWLLEGIYKIDTGSLLSATVTFWNGSTAAGTLGSVLTLPKGGGSITATDDGSGVTAGTILQQESESNTLKYFSYSLTLPDPSGGLEWRITIDPVSTVSGPVTPIEFTKLTLRRVS